MLLRGLRSMEVRDVQPLKNPEPTFLTSLRGLRSMDSSDEQLVRKPHPTDEIPLNAEIFSDFTHWHIIKK